MDRHSDVVLSLKHENESQVVHKRVDLSTFHWNCDDNHLCWIICILHEVMTLRKCISLHNKVLHVIRLCRHKHCITVCETDRFMILIVGHWSTKSAAKYWASALFQASWLHHVILHLHKSWPTDWTSTAALPIWPLPEINLCLMPSFGSLIKFNFHLSHISLNQCNYLVKFYTKVYFVKLAWLH